jgi:hypothetical protein
MKQKLKHTQNIEENLNKFAMSIMCESWSIKNEEEIRLTYLYHAWCLEALPSCHLCQGRCCPQHSANHAHNYAAA